METTKFPFKLIWIQSDSSQDHSSFPSYLLEMDERAIRSVCEHIQNLGYNGLVLGCCPHFQEGKRYGDIVSIIKHFVDKGINVFIKPNSELAPSPLSPSFKKYLKNYSSLFNEIEGNVFLFWQSGLLGVNYHADQSAREATFLDILLKELAEVELLSAKKIIFYIPCSNNAMGEKIAKAIDRISNCAAKKTTIAFSAFAGEPYADHLPLHPLWKRLEQIDDPINTSLLPILNLGGAHLGNGNWPSIPFDIYERIYPRLKFHNFEGIISLAGSISNFSNLAACNLLAGTKLLEDHSLDACLESWLKNQKTTLNFEQLRNIFQNLRMLILDLSLLKQLTIKNENYLANHEESRLHVEYISTKLKYFSYRAKKEPFLNTYYETLISDGKEILGNFTQVYNITYSSHV